MPLFVMGKIVNTHGIKGELKLYPFTDDASRIENLERVLLRKDALEREYTLVSSRPHKNIVIIKLEGVDDMNAAEKLIGFEMAADSAELPPLDENEYYVRDLYGLRVETEDGSLLGVLSDVIHTGANDVYAVKPEGRGKEILLPAIEKCIIKIDIPQGVMTVRLMEGLI